MHPLIKNCKCNGPCTCTPLTNNCAESANRKIKQSLKDKLLRPLKLIEELESLTKLQLLNFKEMFKNQGSFYFPAGNFELSTVDDEYYNNFVNSLYDQFFSDDLFSSSVDEAFVNPIKKRNFKVKLGSNIIVINEKTYAQSTDKESLYPVSALLTAHKPCNVNKKTWSLKKF